MCKMQATNKRRLEKGSHLRNQTINLAFHPLFLAEGVSLILQESMLMLAKFSSFTASVSESPKTGLGT